MLGEIDHLFEGNSRCFLIKIKVAKLNFIKKEIRKCFVQSDTAIYSGWYSASLCCNLGYQSVGSR